MGSSWIIDSGCTNHMTGEKKMFTPYIKNKDSQDTIIFGDGNQGKVMGLGRKTGGNNSSKQKRDDNVKTTGTSTYGSLLAVVYLSIGGSMVL
jgi:hypothetical protein